MAYGFNEQPWCDNGGDRDQPPAGDGQAVDERALGERALHRGLIENVLPGAGRLGRERDADDSGERQRPGCSAFEHVVSCLRARIGGLAFAALRRAEP